MMLWTLAVVLGSCAVGLGSDGSNCGCPAGTECRLMPGDEEFGLDFRCVAPGPASSESKTPAQSGPPAGLLGASALVSSFGEDRRRFFQKRDGRREFFGDFKRSLRDELRKRSGRHEFFGDFDKRGHREFFDEW